MWVGFLFSFCAGKKNKINFHQICTVLSKSFLFSIYHYRICMLVCLFKLVANVGSYMQGRITGGFLSSRKAAWAERCPPKTTDAAIDE